MKSVKKLFKSTPFMLAIIALIISLAGCALQPKPKPPVAKIMPLADTLFGDIRVDNYYWLRDRGKPEVIAYLEAENAYTDAIMKHTEGLQDVLYNEMESRIKQTDMEVPVKIDDYYYYSRTEEGKQYKIYCRKKGSLDAVEEVMLDPNVLAGKRQFFDIGSYSVSDDQNMLAYTVDTTGSEIYTVYFKNLATGATLSDQIINTDSEVIWAGDNATVFYTTLGETHQPNKAWCHKLGNNPADDNIVYEEYDETFYLGVSKTKSRKYIILSLEGKITSEMHYLPADQPEGAFKVIQPRVRGLEYYVEDHDGQFIIRTNDNALNFKVVAVSADNPAKQFWRDLLPYVDSVTVEDIDVFKDYLVVFERIKGLENIRIYNFKTGDDYFIDFPEPDYAIWGERNPDYNSELVRFDYTSFITPRSIYDYNMTTRQRELKKQYEVLGGYSPDNYQLERLYAQSNDSVMVPISLVYKKGMAKDGSSPVILHGYGAYGISSDPYFSSSQLSLLDRGFIVGIAHIRGGGELGQGWYDDGKLLEKKNTFIDFIACSDYLINAGYTSPGKIIAWDGSAGGMTVGAVANMKPNLFKAIIADVPFVDVLNTMLDASIPLTVLEYDEWGDPNQKDYYFYIKSYSPYDNVAAQNYPDMLILAGLNDPRVQYWEPAKWTAKLRATKTDTNTLLLKTNMGQGHLGASGRYDYLHDLAFEFAYVLDIFGMKK